ncbi:MAG: UPF0147 family protein [Candidatus Woesearchaeota archaeon]|nr:UPF0147 family protein [Candidatus Woesearchaeota archaeon]
MVQEFDFGKITGMLEELKDDAAVPKNVKIKIDSIIEVLNGDSDTSIKLNKALHALDEIANDANLQSYARTQIWNIVSVLEKVSAS